MSRSIALPLHRRDRRPAPLLAGFLLTAGVLAAALAGCGPAAPELGSDAARELQSQVLAVTEAAASDDSPGSLKLLDELVTTLDDAAARGEVSFQRRQIIRTSIDAVRADLTAKEAAAVRAAAAAAPGPAPAVVPPAPTPAPGKADKPKGKHDGNG
ncbi:mucin-associated surface protein [Pseudarthrobacter sp. S9]|uniref:mucin-associated surface protein n=1 Tax=Pseudarthrobacter sp. S9 TaxID=3418421 RepID=UPI003D04842A